MSGGFGGVRITMLGRTRNLVISEPAGKYDDVRAPAHYCGHKHTHVEVVQDWELDYFLGNVLKCIERRKLKGHELQDLMKAKKWLEMEIELVERGELKESITHG